MRGGEVEHMRARFCKALNGNIVRFGCAAREDNVITFAFNETCHRKPCFLERLSGPSALRVRPRMVASDTRRAIKVDSLLSPHFCIVPTYDTTCAPARHCRDGPHRSWQILAPRLYPQGERCCGRSGWHHPARCRIYR